MVGQQKMTTYTWFVLLIVVYIVVLGVVINNNIKMTAEAFAVSTKITSSSLSSYEIMSSIKNNNIIKLGGSLIVKNNNIKKSNVKTILHDYYNDDTTYTLSVEDNAIEEQLQQLEQQYHHDIVKLRIISSPSSSSSSPSSSSSTSSSRTAIIEKEKQIIMKAKKQQSLHYQTIRINRKSPFIIASKKKQKQMNALLLEQNNNNNNNNNQQQQQQQHKLDSYVHRGHTNVEFVAETNLPTQYGMYRLRGYRIPDSQHIGQEPCVIYYPHDNQNENDDDVTEQDQIPYQHANSIDIIDDAIPVRIHDQCMTSEVFGSLRCDCKEQLDMSYQYIQNNGGIIIYLQQEGRGIGIANKIAAYSLQDTGIYDTVDSNRLLHLPDDNRDYSIIPSILKDMNITKIKLMTNNPRKSKHLIQLGIDVVDTIPIVIPKANEYNYRYMKAKEERMEHNNLHELTLLKPSKSEMIEITSSSKKRKHALSLLASSSSSLTAVHQNTNNDNLISTSEMIEVTTTPSTEMNNRNNMVIPSSSTSIINVIEKSPTTITMIITMWIMIMINIVS